ncbi:hypothetical protein [Nostoc sp. CHAB 5715]|uniref:hypothetical protein n=1 Tax=Nostoc sp. CHAB 5715 TaxID=2780400 RepID=UPI001E31E76B|nr:hypothetical protein [Nostoc sp. CHAB 5715]MCC5622703.1 hypothetical protein [Nostoc sp. CHAB 5715]
MLNITTTYHDETRVEVLYLEENDLIYFADSSIVRLSLISTGTYDYNYTTKSGIKVRREYRRIIDPKTVVLTDARVERALTIEVLEQHGDEFVVHNCENDHYYVVRPNHLEPALRCECADCHYREVLCKHQIAVENFLGQSLETAILKVAASLDDLLDTEQLVEEVGQS